MPPIKLVDHAKDYLLVYDSSSNRFLFVTDKSILSSMGRLNCNNGNFSERDLFEILKEKYRDTPFFNNVTLCSPQEAYVRLSQDWKLHIDKEKHTCLRLELTQHCNFKCTYCEQRFYYDEKPARFDMSFDIASRSIDYFCDKFPDLDQYIIALYGGEPLLRKELIYNILDYCQTEHKDLNFYYIINTNGYLLDIEFVSRVKDHNVQLYVSIDGSEELNDTHRRTVDGMPTFMGIEKNMKDLRSSFPDFYRNCIAVLCVIDLCQPLDKYYESFEKSEVFKGINVRYLTKIENTFAPSNSDQRMKCYENYWCLMNKFPKRFEKSVGVSQLDQGMMDMLQKLVFKQGELEEKILLPGMCFPSLSEIFVTANGDFKICGRSVNDFVIGDIYSGYDFDIAREIIESYYEIVDTLCSNCYMIRLCNPCIAMFLKRGRLQKDTVYCEHMKAKADIVFNFIKGKLVKEWNHGNQPRIPGIAPSISNGSPGFTGCQSDTNH
ncbi:hypothetical protein CEE37_01585 [candidate division LCP-89 bacterium B3_LCP]|uniref:Radical SAM core domain-containing protein n=1 Tax=candidate division LCP-89 bacterium B3_LCP TaxID=2012998 RepID=A0A532V5D6_UNCL8|nr:MAG: hypothetical protein CEE37_01585 [candidate division LCP-89 bacterium B3_LCP]